MVVCCWFCSLGDLYSMFILWYRGLVVNCVDIVNMCDKLPLSYFFVMFPKLASTQQRHLYGSNYAITVIVVEHDAA